MTNLFPNSAGASLCMSSLWVEREQRKKRAAGLFGEVCAQHGLLAEVAGAESPPFRVGGLCNSLFYPVLIKSGRLLGWADDV